MPLDRLVLIIFVCVGCVFAAIWLAVIVTAGFQTSAAWIVLVPAAVAGYLLWRVVSDRLGNAEDDHYDNIDR